MNKLEILLMHDINGVGVAQGWRSPHVLGGGGDGVGSRSGMMYNRNKTCELAGILGQTTGI